MVVVNQLVTKKGEIMSHGAKERRRAVRLRPAHAKAVCSTHNAGGVYAIHDVSNGGALLQGKPVVPPGTRVSLRMLLPGVAPMNLAGRVVRTSMSAFTDACLAVKFCGVSPDDEDRFADLIAREWSKTCAPHAIVASSSLHLRMDLTRRLASVGASVSRATTPIELIYRLEAARGRCVVVFLGTTVGGCSGVELASFLATAYPQTRRVLVTEVGEVPAHPLPKQLHAFMQAPWRANVLQNVLLEAEKTASRSRWGSD